jgi:hypothetical protein
MDILEIFSYMVVIVVPLLFIITTIDHLIILNKLKKQEEILFRLGIQNRMDQGNGDSFKEVSKNIDKEWEESLHVVDIKEQSK